MTFTITTDRPQKADLDTARSDGGGLETIPKNKLIKAKFNKTSSMKLIIIVESSIET